MILEFEWDARKAAENLKNHRVSFEDRRGKVRVISSRKATAKEKKLYENY